MTPNALAATVGPMMLAETIVRVALLPGVTHGDRTVLSAMAAMGADSEAGKVIDRRRMQAVTGLSRVQLERSFTRLVSAGVLAKEKSVYLVPDHPEKNTIFKNIYQISFESLRDLTGEAFNSAFE